MKSLFCVVSSLFCSQLLSISIGSKVIDFTLLDETGKEFSTQQMVGKKYALMFLPNLHVPFSRCKKQTCALQNELAALKDKGIEVIAITSSSQKKNRKFAAKNNLGFPLLSDTGKKISKKYGVVARFFVSYIERTTVLVDEKGIVVSVIDNVNVKNHAQQILDGFKNK
jgi:peroxiredoxin Q/BCP